MQGFKVLPPPRPKINFVSMKKGCSFAAPFEREGGVSWGVHLTPMAQWERRNAYNFVVRTGERLPALTCFINP